MLWNKIETKLDYISASAQQFDKVRPRLRNIRAGSSSTSSMIGLMRGPQATLIGRRPQERRWRTMIWLVFSSYKSHWHQWLSWAKLFHFRHEVGSWAPRAWWKAAASERRILRSGILTIVCALAYFTDTKCTPVYYFVTSIPIPSPIGLAWLMRCIAATSLICMLMHIHVPP